MSMGALMHAMEWPRHHPDVTKIRQYVVKGRLPYQDKEIVVGKELADMLDLHVGSELKVLSPVDGKSYEFTVSGIFACGMYDYDSNIVFCGIEDAQKIFVMPGAITGVGVRLTDPYMADNFARRLSKDINYMYSIRTWADLNRNLFSALKLEKLTMFIILALIVVVACFNIASTLIMMVIEKTKDIGILKSIGATNKMVNLIFTLEGLLIGLMGTVSGMVIGLGLCAFLKKYQFIQLPKEIYYIDHLPVQMQWSDAIIISASAILISLFATVYPAWQASRLNAVDALRYE